jgi:GNAT superfamily N-acetyltransferase
MSKMLAFKPVTNFKPNSLYNILFSSYQELIKNINLENKKKYLTNWREFDYHSFNTPGIGDCVFISCLADKPIGLASFDPRQFPKIGIIGQNCILPEYRGKGYGKKQIEEILKIFSVNNCQIAQVTTGAIEFFQPAQKMYQSLDFQEINRQFDKDWGYEIIRYEKNIGNFNIELPTLD